MKKSKLSIGLVTSFIAALGLSACSGAKVTKNSTEIVTIKGYDGSTISINTSDLYNEYRGTSDGISKYYSAILETLIRHDYKNIEESDLSVEKDYELIEKEAKDKVKAAKTTAKENSKTNDTKYSTEWKNILSNNGVEDEEHLLQKYIYDAEKEQLEDAYFGKNKASLLEEYIGVTSNGKKAESKVDSVFPYHIRHILLSVDGGDKDFYNDTITESEAKTIVDVLSKLVDSNYTFGQIAYQYSGDSGSATKYGDAGIMSTTTSFINEFKLGIYAYDALFSGRSSVVEGVKEGLGLTSDLNNSTSSGTVEEALNTIGNKDANLSLTEGKFLSKVPYGVFSQLEKLYKDTKNESSKLVNDGDEHYYPRNILWNRYLNLHNAFVITNEDITWSNNGTDSVSGTAVTSSRFNSDGYLCDENGNVIIGVRGSYGIHLMIMQRSVLDVTTTKGGTLEDYYTMSVPTDSDYPEVENTYVSYLSTEVKSTYETRAKEIKDAVKAFDSTYDYRLYEYLVNKYESVLSFNGNGTALDLGKLIEKYIETQRNSNKESRAKDLNSKWREYVELLQRQFEERTLLTSSNKDGRLVPTVCAIAFGANTDGLYNKGGLCYHEK